jgi:hypothetical protein
MHLAANRRASRFSLDTNAIIDTRGKTGKIKHIAPDFPKLAVGN